MREKMERFSKYMEIKGLNDNQVTNDCGLSVGLLGQARKGKSDLGAKAIDKILITYQDLNRVWLLTGDGEMINDVQVTRMDHPKSAEKLGDAEVPLYDIDAAANLRTLMGDKASNILGMISIPNIPSCDGAVYVRGDSMYPILKTGDIVAYKMVGDLQALVDGEMYLVNLEIDGDEYLTVKYVHRSSKGDGWVQLASYNPHHGPMDVKVENIKAIALVKFSVRINTMV
jgi:phage repressor protein C with HTH and peptisase S24 domain